MNNDQLKIEQYKHHIQFGEKFPYDRDETINQTPKPLTPELRAAYGVLSCLLDRRGIKEALEEVDFDIREEIVETLAGIIKEAMK